MITGSTGSSDRSYNRTFTLIAGISVAALGGAALAGWVFHIEALKSLLPGAEPMRPNMAVGFLLCGAALALLARKILTSRARLCTAAMATIVIVTALLILGQYIFGWNLGINEWPVGGRAGNSPLGPVTPATALSFLALGSVLLAYPGLRSRLPLVAAAGLSGGHVVLAGSALVGVFMKGLFGPSWNHTGLDVSTVPGAIGFLLLGLGLFALLQRKGALAWALDAYTTTAFAFSIVLMVISSAAAFNFTAQVVETTNSVAFRQETLTEIQEVMTSLPDLANHQRFFAVTGDEDSLGERSQTKASLSEDLSRVRALTIDNPKQQRQLDQLEPLIAQRLAREEQMIMARRQAGSSGGPAQLLLTGPDQKLSETIAALLTQMQVEEIRTLSWQQKQAARAKATAFSVLPLGGFLSLTVLSLVLLLLNSGMNERKKAETSLRRSEEGMRAILESALDCIITMDHTGRVIEFNAAAEKTFGYRREEAVGQMLAELIIPPSLRARHQKGLAHYLATENGPALGQRLELSAVRRDGQEFPVELAITRIGTQKPPRFTGFIRDITERKTAAEQLQVQARQYRLLFEDNPTPMWVYEDQSMNVLAVNAAAISSYGYSREEFLARTLRDLGPAEDGPMLVESINEAGAASSFGGDWRHVKKDGSIITVAVYSSPITFDNKAARMALAFDQTERAEAERKVRASEANLAVAQRVAGVGSWEYHFTPEGTLAPKTLIWSEEAYRLFGLSSACQISTETLFQSVHLEDRELLGRHFGAFMEGTEPFNLDYRIVRPDGTERVLNAVAEKIVNPQTGAPLKIVGTFLDITERKAAEKQLREADEKYRSIFDNALEGIFQNTPEGTVISANPALARMLGFDSPEELIRERNDIEQQGYVDPTQRQEFRRKLEADGFINNFEFEMKRKDGSVICISENSRVVRDGAGKVLYYEGSMRDVTDRKRAEETLRESEERFRELADSITDAFWITSPDLKTVHYVSPGYEVIYGRSVEALYAHPQGWSDAILPEDRERVFAVFTALTEDESETSVEYRLARPDGTIRWVHSRGFQVRDAAGTVVRLTGVVTDITERKQAEEKLRQSQSLIRIAGRISRVGGWAISVPDNVVTWSREVWDILGFSGEEEPSLEEALNLYPPESRERVGQAIAACGREGTPFDLDLELHDAERRKIWARVCGEAERDTNGKITQVRGAFSDITDRKRADVERIEMNTQLVAASRQAGMAEVATSVLHNVGNVLNSVNVSCSIISDKVRGSRISSVARTADLLREHSEDLAAFITTDPTGRKLPEFIGKLATQLSAEQAVVLAEVRLLHENIEHIKGVIAVQQSHARNLGGVRETLPIAELLEEVLRMNASSLVQNRIEVLREYADVPPLSLEKHKVLQILVNLIGNAQNALVDRGQEHKQMVLRIARNNGHVAVSVSDNGIGIAPENTIRIFAHGFTTRKDGHGFGLHSGVLAAQEMGGKLTVQSDGLGTGATFTLKLPVGGHGNS